MTCGKCGGEMNASAKFCPTCGTPSAPAASPSAANLLADAAPPTTHPNLIVLPDIAMSGPSSGVNPFATTAAPGSAKPSLRASSEPALKVEEPKIADKTERDENKPSSKSEPPPQSPRAVSPLALSSGVAGVTPSPFQQALQKARESVAPGMPSTDARGDTKKAKKPGTYVMQNAPIRPGKPASEPPPATTNEASAAPAKKPVARTVAMVPPTPSRPQTGPAPVSTAPAAMPHSVGMPQSVGLPPSGPMPPNVQRSGPASGYQQPWPQPQRPPQPLAPYQAPPPAQYPAPQWGQPPRFAYQPGARVQVTWSNGQRYPATVSQISPTQCLVVFPDGQQHWVDMQYLTPG